MIVYLQHSNAQFVMLDQNCYLIQCYIEIVTQGTIIKNFVITI
jgi:hypothetical protein